MVTSAKSVKKGAAKPVAGKHTASGDSTIKKSGALKSSQIDGSVKKASSPAAKLSTKKVQPKPGTVVGNKNFTPELKSSWKHILHNINKTAKNYGFEQIRVNIFDDETVASEFLNQIQMPSRRLASFNVASKNFALRSAILPSVLKHYVDQKIAETSPIAKWFYLGNIVSVDENDIIHSSFEYGFEVLGGVTNLTEAQVISALWQIYSGIGFKDLLLEINTIGDAATQSAYQSVLKDFLKGKEFELCGDCAPKVSSNALQILRCQNADCQVVVSEAPMIVDFIDVASKKAFTDTLEALDEIHIPYQLNPFYVGKPGSSFTSFVIKVKTGSDFIVLGEGSRHDLMIKQIAGKPQPAFGFVGSLENLEHSINELELELIEENDLEVFLVPLGELASKKSLKLFCDLIDQKIKVHDHFGSIGVKNQLKLAEEYKAPIALIMGQKEAMDEMVILRDVKSGMQEVFSYDKIIDEVKKRLGY